MKNKKKGSVVLYKSFEKWQAELFPLLIEEERRKAGDFDAKQLGVNLANESIDRLLKSTQA